MGYYFAQLKNTSRVEVFYSRYTPTESTHGHLYGWVTGPYKTKERAIEAAQYQFTPSYSVIPIPVHCIDNRRKQTESDRNLARILGH